jgi:Kef-type K+ transport system membrane component KefB
MIVGLATRGEDGKLFRIKLDAIFFGWFTPFFFVGTGVEFDVAALTRNLETMLLIPTLLVLFVAARGVPVLLYRNDIAKSEQPPFALFSSVAALGLIVVITQIGLRARNMNPDIAQALIAAALLSSLVNLTLGNALLSRAVGPAARPA